MLCHTRCAACWHTIGILQGMLQHKVSGSHQRSPLHSRTMATSECQESGISDGPAGHDRLPSLQHTCTDQRTLAGSHSAMPGSTTNETAAQVYSATSDKSQQLSCKPEAPATAPSHASGFSAEEHSENTMPSRVVEVTIRLVSNDDAQPLGGE